MLFRSTSHHGSLSAKLRLDAEDRLKRGELKALVATASLELGIDINPNRLDDARHLALEPFHDVHTQVRGPAARELELSFAERWSLDGGGTSLAFEPADPATIETPGFDVVQVGRTYFQPANSSRALSFAPHGDDTIRRTLLGAIANAQELILVEDQYFTPPGEYTDALAAKLAARDIHTLLIVLTGVTDQPFGEQIRSAAIEQLRAAATVVDLAGIYVHSKLTIVDDVFMSIRSEERRVG